MPVYPGALCPRRFPKDPIQRFADILENIIVIEEFARGMA
jgi:hypothetical protein